MDGVLPACLCATCSGLALEAANFRTFCRTSEKRWHQSIDLLAELPILDEVPKRNKGIFAILGENTLTLMNEWTGGLDEKTAASKLRNRLSQANSIQQRLEAEGCGCPDCGKRFLYPLNLYLHLKESGEDKRACRYCADVMSRDELVQHLIQIHDKIPHTCDKCPAMFRGGRQLAKHLKLAHGPGAVRCGDCGRSYRSVQAFNAHFSVHQSKMCPGCGTLFRNMSCYSYHVKQCCNLELEENDAETVTEPVYKHVRKKRKNIGAKGSSAARECYCDYCGKKFSGKKYVKAHIQIVHSTSTHRACPYCGKYLAAAHMTEHIKKHKYVRTYSCNYCGIVLKSDLGMKQHLRLHTGEKPYQCDECGESFSASSRRSEHIKKMHKADNALRHSCDRCPARFKLPYQLRKHLSSVHMNRSEGEFEFECDECGEKFGSCRGLIHHRRKHQQVQLKQDVSVDERSSMYQVHSELRIDIY